MKVRNTISYHTLHERCRVGGRRLNLLVIDCGTPLLSISLTADVSHTTFNFIFSNERISVVYYYMCLRHINSVDYQVQRIRVD